MTQIKKIQWIPVALLLVSCGSGLPTRLLTVAGLGTTTPDDSGDGGGGGEPRSFKYLKVTTQTFNGNLGEIAGADAKCAAEFPGYKALVASFGAGRFPGGADWPLAAATEYRRADGTTVIGTTLGDGMFDFGLGLLNAVTSEAVAAWTGLQLDEGSWSNHATCDLYDHVGGISHDWTAETDFYPGEQGSANSTGSGMLDTGTDATCDSTAHLYCVEQ